MALLADRGDLKRAEAGGLERETVLELVQRLKPDETLDSDRAITELENAITIALDVIARGKRGSNEDEFVNDVLKTVAAHTQAGRTNALFVHSTTRSRSLSPATLSNVSA